MSQLCRLYRNPSLPKGRYFVKVVRLHQEPASRRPFIEVILRVSDIHDGYGGKELYVPIHPTPDADPVHRGFLETFDLEAHEIGKAVGRYARVMVKRRTYDGTEYRGVCFVPQRDCDYADAAAARKADKAKVEQAEKKAAEKAKKMAAKEAWEAVHGPRGRGRPRKNAVLMKTPDLLG